MRRSPLLLSVFCLTLFSDAAPAAADPQSAMKADYARTVLPLCRQAVDAQFPFFAQAPTDSNIADVRRVLAPGGVLERFVATRLAPLIDRSGPIWRWKAGRATASLDPAVPDMLDRGLRIGELVDRGQPLRVSLYKPAANARTSTLVVDDARFSFSSDSPEPRGTIWSAETAAMAAMIIEPADVGEAPAVSGHRGAWALFRLIAEARVGNAGPNAIIAEFGRPPLTSGVRIEFLGDHNPYSRGFWAFRCPASL